MMLYLLHIQKLIYSFNWHTPSWDLFIVLSWIVGSVLYAFAAGRGRILGIVVSVYMAKLLVIEAPFLSSPVIKQLHGQASYIQQLVTFIVLFLLLFMFLSRYAFRTSVDGRKLGSFVFIVIFALLQVGLLINIILNFLPEYIQKNFAPLIRFWFLDKPANFVWLLAPIAFLIVLGRFISEKTEI